jgi:uncharacterized ParB-like nuclease family protein
MMAKKEKLDIVRIEVSPDDLRVNNWNPNEMAEKEFELLKEQIAEVGFIDPPTVVEVEGEGGEVYYRLIGGAHRARAAQELGLKKIPVDVLQGDRWRDEDLQKFQTVRLNILHGKMKPEKFVSLYNQMAEKYGADKVSRMMGYTKEDGVRKMVAQVAKGMKDSMSPEMAQQFQEQAKEARTVGDIERIITNLFQEHGDSIKYNFMVFAWGGKEHIYVAMSKKTREAMKKIMKASRTQAVDINELIGEAIEGVAKSLPKNVSKTDDEVAPEQNASA